MIGLNIDFCVSNLDIYHLEAIEVLVKVLVFLGSSGSGKTTSIVELISRLNCSVGTVKFMHHDRLDIEPSRKDTSKHVDAGSMFTVGVARKETVVRVPVNERMGYDEIEKMLGVLPRVDLVIVESLFSPPKGSGIIISGCDEEDLEGSLKRIRGSYSRDQILAVVGKVSESQSSWDGIPCVDAEGLTKIVKRFIDS